MAARITPGSRAGRRKRVGSVSRERWRRLTSPGVDVGMFHSVCCVWTSRSCFGPSCGSSILTFLFHFVVCACFHFGGLLRACCFVACKLFYQHLLYTFVALLNYKCETILPSKKQRNRSHMNNVQAMHIYMFFCM